MKSTNSNNNLDLYCNACGHMHSPNNHTENNNNDHTNNNNINSRNYYKNTNMQPMVSLNYLTQMKNVNKDLADCV